MKVVKIIRRMLPEHFFLSLIDIMKNAAIVLNYKFPLVSCLYAFLKNEILRRFF